MIEHHHTLSTNELAFKSIQTEGVHEHEFALPNNWHAHYDQISSGEFKGRIDQLSIMGIDLIRETTNQSIIKRGMLNEDSLTFSMPTNQAEETFYCDGRKFSSDNFLFSPADDLPEIQTSTNFSVLCVSVNKAKIFEYLNNQNLDPQFLEKSQIYPIDNYAAQAEKNNMTGLLNSLLDPQKTSPFLHYSGIQSSIHDTILQSVIDLSDHQHEVHLTPMAQKKLVDRAREYVLSCTEAAPSILELCSILGTSRRKLQYCFQQTLGINPIAYLRLIRLNAAHRELCQADGQTSVQDIASKWGFMHLSRFAAEYRTLFDELPSQTLKNAHMNCAKIG
ncbi:helix-turn-helix domain-containing protein [Marinomonas sp. THO17]|uniref:helix-turn-helix domain-containing protein n=1 Tax=Marinomonas sp. THO17 TaxID=3149048 RepID=UPI00336C0280